MKLLQAGYDVWLGNNRGNVYSRGHVSLSADDDEFFDYSFYEMGKYDLPAMLDLIRSETSFDKVAIFAHSQGTSQTFSALSENYESIRSKISFFAAFAPVVQLRNTQSNFFKKWGVDVDTIQWWLDSFGIVEIFGPDWHWIKSSFCLFN